MRSSIAALALAAALTACATAEKQAAPSPTSPYIVAAIAATTRPAADRARDADRKPAEMLAFAGVRPGQHIADFIPGGGYFTRIFAGAVGSSGRVYALIPPSPPDATAEPPIKAVAAQYPNVTVVQQSFTTLSVPEPLDLIWTSQNYHDLHLARFKLDVAAVNRQIFNALKPGGVYVVLDHSARAGAEVGVADTLHRIDQAIVRRELEAAGFVYDGESDVLRNPADTRELPVFDPSIRGHTDQFILRFRRPS
jgi:predicted methyltransferase